jgi:hypothetical protein
MEGGSFLSTRRRNLSPHSGKSSYNFLLGVKIKGVLEGKMVKG